MHSTALIHTSSGRVRPRVERSVLYRVAMWTAGSVVAALLLEYVLVTAAFSSKLLGYSGPLDAMRGGAPRWSTMLAGVPVDEYRRGSGGTPLLLVHGMNPDGRNDPDLIRVAEGLAQTGYRVVVPDFQSIRQGRIDPEDVGRIRQVYDALDGDGGLVCVSYGCGPALVAAAGEPIRDRLRFIVTFGGYTDLAATLRFLATQYRDPGGSTKWHFLAANADLFDDPFDRCLIEESPISDLEDPRRRASLVAQMTPEGQSIVALFSSEEGAAFDQAMNRAPDSLLRRLDLLSPGRHIRGISALLIIVHGAHDPFIPASESLALAGFAREHEIAHTLTLLNIYGHTHPVWPEFGLRSLVGFYLPEGMKMARLALHVLALR